MEPGPGDREAGPREAEPGRPRVRRRIDDRALMGVLIPAFGLTIPHATGLFGPLGAADPAWWWGHAWFVAGAASIYLANRALLFAGRVHADWFSRPVARLVLLAAQIVFGTVPTTVAMLLGWTALSGVPLGPAGPQVVLVNIICVLFVTWLYEMLFLIRERVDDQLQLERLAAARTQAELDAIRAHVDPHFLFNALNTLAALVEGRPADARRFVDHLARVYRSVLDTRSRDLVPLAEELELARAYSGLLEIRFGGAVEVRFDVHAVERWAIPPGASQVLLENAVKHNVVDPDEPLRVSVAIEDAHLVVAHPHRPRPRPGAGTGLAHLSARSRAISGRAVELTITDEVRVCVPLVEAR